MRARFQSVILKYKELWDFSIHTDICVSHLVACDSEEDEEEEEESSDEEGQEGGVKKKKKSKRKKPGIKRSERTPNSSSYLLDHLVPLSSHLLSSPCLLFPAGSALSPRAMAELQAQVEKEKSLLQAGENMAKEERDKAEHELKRKEEELAKAQSVHCLSDMYVCDGDKCVCYVCVCVREEQSHLEKKLQDLQSKVIAAGVSLVSWSCVTVSICLW